MFLSELVAGSRIFSKAVFMQLLNSQQALQKELQNTKCFFNIFIQNTCTASTQQFEPQFAKKTFSVLETLLQTMFCIQKLQKHHLAGNAVASKKLRQRSCLEKGQKFNNMVQISLMQF